MTRQGRKGRRTNVGKGELITRITRSLTRARGTPILGPMDRDLGDEGPVTWVDGRDMNDPLHPHEKFPVKQTY